MQSAFHERAHEYPAWLQYPNMMYNDGDAHFAVIDIGAS